MNCISPKDMHTFLTIFTLLVVEAVARKNYPYVDMRDPEFPVGYLNGSEKIGFVCIHIERSPETNIRGKYFKDKYLYLSCYLTTWVDASSECEKMGGSLLPKEQNRIIFSLELYNIKNYCKRVWVGFQDILKTEAHVGSPTVKHDTFSSRKLRIELTSTKLGQYLIHASTLTTESGPPTNQLVIPFIWIKLIIGLLSLLVIIVLAVGLFGVIIFVRKKGEGIYKDEEIGTPDHDSLTSDISYPQNTEEAVYKRTSTGSGSYSTASSYATANNSRLSSRSYNGSCKSRSSHYSETDTQELLMTNPEY